MKKILALTLALVTLTAGSVFASNLKVSTTTAKNQRRLVVNKQVETTPIGKNYWVFIQVGKNKPERILIDAPVKVGETQDAADKKLFDRIIMTTNNKGQAVVTPMHYTMDIKTVSITEPNGNVIINRTITDIQAQKIK